jgi:uncharacterized protein (DUF2147 family)
MKKLMLSIVVLLVTGSVVFAVDPAEGFWLSVDDKTSQVTGGWQIYVENNRLYGKLLSSAAAPEGSLAIFCKDSYPDFPLPGRVSQMLVLGTPWIYGLQQDKTGEWSKGTVIDPNDGKSYRCKIIFHPAGERRFTADTLEMRGEIGLGIGRSQYWRRASEAEVRGLR